jgi:hypothetical protein
MLRYFLINLSYLKIFFKKKNKKNLYLNLKKIEFKKKNYYIYIKNLL